MSRSLRHRISAYWRDRSGVSAPMFALLLTVLVGMGGFTIDIGHVMWVQRSLQESSDAAALAGGIDVVDAPSSAVTLANTYSSQAGGKNVIPGVTATSNAALKCFKSITVPACSGGTYNGIQVTQQASVPMWFSQVFGVKTATVSATSTASAKGGVAKSLDIVIILDATASMNTADNKCSGGTTRIACAKYGVIELLNGLNPTTSKVSVMVFPGYNTQAQATSESTCSPTKSSSSISKYAPYASGTAPYYSVTSADNTFKVNAGSKTLNTSSSIVTAAGGGTCGTSGGIQAVGGVQTDYSEVLWAAEQALLNDGNSNTQKVIVILSDGDANSSAVTGGLSASNECQMAIAAANAATANGIWVYSIAYGAATSGSCSTDKTNLGTTTRFGQTTTVNSKSLSACQAMTAIASDSSKFYSDNASGCVGTGGTDSDVDKLFSQIGLSLTMPRLISNNTT